MSLAELAETSGIPARTIRFYISRGILQPPLKAGRAAAYGPEHVERLERIKAMQAEGRMLSEIGREVESERPAVLKEPTAWWQHTIAGDVVVWTRADAAPWRIRQVRGALEDFARALNRNDDNKEKKAGA